MKWIVGSGIHSYWLGTYEIEKQMAIKAFIKPRMRVFDIGANAGFYTLSFSRLVGIQGQVWAFEPFAENAANILRHTKLNYLQNVVLMQVVVADRTGMVGFQATNNNAMGAISEEKQYRVPAVSLDNLLADQLVPVPDLIKIDVEGAESLVLEGAKSILDKKKSILFIALHGDEQKQRCQEILESSGYNIFFLDGSALGSSALRSDEIYALPY